MDDKTLDYMADRVATGKTIKGKIDTLKLAISKLQTAKKFFKIIVIDQNARGDDAFYCGEHSFLNELTDDLKAALIPVFEKKIAELQAEFERL